MACNLRATQRLPRCHTASSGRGTRQVAVRFQPSRQSQPAGVRIVKGDPQDTEGTWGDKVAVATSVISELPRPDESLPLHASFPVTILSCDMEDDKGVIACEAYAACCPASAVAEGVYKAMGEGDIERICGVLTPDFVLTTNLPNFQAMYQGPDGFRAFSAQLTQMFEITDMRGRAKKARPNGPVTSSMQWTGTCRATGRTMTTDIKHNWAIGEDGRICKIEEHVDAAAFARLMNKATH